MDGIKKGTQPDRVGEVSGAEVTLPTETLARMSQSRFSFTSGPAAIRRTILKNGPFSFEGHLVKLTDQPEKHHGNGGRHEGAEE